MAGGGPGGGRPLGPPLEAGRRGSAFNRERSSLLVTSPVCYNAPLGSTDELRAMRMRGLTIARRLAGGRPCVLAVSRPRLALPAHHLQQRQFAASPQASAPADDAYSVLGVQKDVSQEDLKAIYKRLAIESHPDRFQGAEREAAEVRFQEISEAYQLLSDPGLRKHYDEGLAAATSEAARKEAASRFRATTWNTKVPDLQARLRKMEREEPPATKGLIAGTLLFLTVNCCLVLNFLGG